MSTRGFSVLLVSLCLLSAQGAGAETAQRANGSDTFVSGSSALPVLDVAGDVFASGGTFVVKGHIAGDAHAAGFNVEIEAPVEGDLYAAGFSVTIRAPVAQDLSATGFNLRTTEAAAVGGNARLAGAAITVDGPVQGALTATGAEITLNAAIGGDVLLTGETVTFGPGATIGGKLVYLAPEPMTIPASVIPAERVTFEKSDGSQIARGTRDIWLRRDEPVWRTVARMFATYLMTMAVLIGLAAVFLALVPERVERMREAALARPAMAVLRGFLGFSVLAGLIPLLALSLIGIPLVPVVVIVIVAACVLACLLGTYTIFLRLYAAFGGAAAPGFMVRLIVLAVGITLLMLLNFIPFLGWFVNFMVVLFGMGAITGAVFSRMTAKPASPGADHASTNAA
jgi:cytoskeletal protein CcmA (bactofilin family)